MFYLFLTTGQVKGIVRNTFEFRGHGIGLHVVRVGNSKEVCLCFLGKCWMYRPRPNEMQRLTDIPELQGALNRLKKGVVPGVDGLPAEAYQRLTLPVKQRPAARLWDIVTGTIAIPP